MSTIKEQQDEEREALISIYEGDLAFKEVNPVTFQYKVSSNHGSWSQLSCLNFL